MKKEKTFIKTNIKTKSVILFLIFALFCIFGISSCAEDLPTDSGDNSFNGNNINKDTNSINNPTNTNNTNIPIQDNTYRYLTYFSGSTNMSYKDTNSLTKLWLNIITNSVFSLDVDNGSEKFNFDKNGDLYWIKGNNSTLIKKFHGGTMVILKGGKYQNRCSVGGVYTWTMSRDEAMANVKGGWLTVYFGVGKGNDGGGKKGKVEILTVNHGYSYDRYKTHKAFALQSYNKPEDDTISKYFSGLKPEDTMPSLKYWDIVRAYEDDTTGDYFVYYR